MAPKQEKSITILPNSFREGVIFYDLPNIKKTKVSDLLKLADEAIEERIVKREIFGPSNRICVTGVEFVLRRQDEYNKFMKKHKKMNPADFTLKDIMRFDPFITYTINCEPCVMKKDRYQWEKLFHEHYENNVVGPMRKEIIRLRKELARLKPITFGDEIEERDKIFDSELNERAELFKKELRSRQELYERELEARDAYIRSLQKSREGETQRAKFQETSNLPSVKTFSDRMRDGDPAFLREPTGGDRVSLPSEMPASGGMGGPSEEPTKTSEGMEPTGTSSMQGRGTSSTQVSSGPNKSGKKSNKKSRS